MKNGRAILLSIISELVLLNSKISLILSSCMILPVRIVVYGSLLQWQDYEFKLILQKFLIPLLLLLDRFSFASTFN